MQAFFHASTKIPVFKDRLKIQVIDGAIISAAILRAREGIVSMSVVFDILRLRNPAVISSTPISENIKLLLEREVLLVFVACIESRQDSEANFEPMVPQCYYLSRSYQ
jgi:hypothetical protein